MKRVLTAALLVAFCAMAFGAVAVIAADEMRTVDAPAEKFPAVGSVQQAKDALLEERIDNARFVVLYKSISDVGWIDSLPIAARKLWPGILRSVRLRRRMIHGTSRIGEESLQRSAWNVLRFINLLRDHPLGNPLKKLPGKSKKLHSDESLRERISDA